MSEKPKDHNDCLHCKFLEAVQTKYPNYEANDTKENTDAFNDVVHAVLAIGAHIMASMEEPQQVQFIIEMFCKAQTIEETTVH